MDDKDAHLGILCGYLENQGQCVVVKVLIQGQQSAMHTTLMEVSCVVPEPNRLDPMNYLVIGPDQHIWRVGAEKEQRQVWPRPLQGQKRRFPDPEPQSTLFVLAPTHSHPPQLSTSSFCPPWHLSSWRTSPYHSILARLQVQANRLSPQSPCIRHPLSLGRNGPFLSLSTFRSLLRLAFLSGQTLPTAPSSLSTFSHPCICLVGGPVLCVGWGLLQLIGQGLFLLQQRAASSGQSLCLPPGSAFLLRFGSPLFPQLEAGSVRQALVPPGCFHSPQRRLHRTRQAYP